MKSTRLSTMIESSFASYSIAELDVHGNLHHSYPFWGAHSKHV